MINRLTGFVAVIETINVTIPTQSDPTILMSVFGWIIIHQHLDVPAIDWQRLWVDYKTGFGSIYDNFWLGLEAMHRLTSSQDYQLRVEVQQWSTSKWYSAEYWVFKISDELDKYRLEVYGYSGDAGDSLQYDVTATMTTTTTMIMMMMTMIRMMMVLGT